MTTAPGSPLFHLPTPPLSPHIAQSLILSGFSQIISVSSVLCCARPLKKESNFKMNCRLVWQQKCPSSDGLNLKQLFKAYFIDCYTKSFRQTIPHTKVPVLICVSLKKSNTPGHGHFSLDCEPKYSRAPGLPGPSCN